MRFQNCSVCPGQPTLKVKIVHYEQRDGRMIATMWKDVPAYNASCLPSNESIEQAWCDQCGLQYYAGEY